MQTGIGLDFSDRPRSTAVSTIILGLELMTNYCVISRH
jgi:hypothetical protein